ncbi:MAG: ABC transporter permease [Eggerthellaceae bacterium]|nr:ABC transporter permease [Eggerthellaceae bacterium]
MPGSTWKLHALRAARILAGLTVGIILWQIMAWVMNSGGNALDFPGPFETIKRLWQYLFCNQSMYGHSVYEHILASIRRLIVAFALACALGIPLGSLLGYFNSIYEIGIVPVSLLQMIPGLAWLPVAILLFGLGDDSAIFIIFAVSSMVITIGTASGIRMVPDVLVNAARMSGASGLTVFFQVLIPQASASIINAMRLGMASAWRVLIAAEMIVGTGIGIGYSVQMTRDLLDYVGAFACIAVICLVGLLFDRVLLGGIEQLMRNRIEGGKR